MIITMKLISMAKGWRLLCMNGTLETGIYWSFRDCITKLKAFMLSEWVSKNTKRIVIVLEEEF